MSSNRRRIGPVFEAPLDGETSHALKRGANVVRAAIVNGGGATDFCARFLDAEDRPVKTISVSLPH
jgi:hypothetical protein